MEPKTLCRKMLVIVFGGTIPADNMHFEYFVIANGYCIDKLKIHKDFCWEEC